jgi:hypothetical protein
MTDRRKANGWPEGLDERTLRRIARYVCFGYADRWIARRLDLKTPQVKVAKGRDDCRARLDEAEIEHQERLRGRQRRLAMKTLTALERLLDAADLILVTLGVEKVIRLTTQGFMPNSDGEDAEALPAGSARAPRALPPASVKDEMAQLRGEA